MACCVEAPGASRAGETRALAEPSYTVHLPRPGLCPVEVLCWPQLPGGCVVLLQVYVQHTLVHLKLTLVVACSIGVSAGSV